MTQCAPPHGHASAYMLAELTKKAAGRVDWRRVRRRSTQTWSSMTHAGRLSSPLTATVGLSGPLLRAKVIAVWVAAVATTVIAVPGRSRSNASVSTKKVLGQWRTPYQLSQSYTCKRWLLRWRRARARRIPLSVRCDQCDVWHSCPGTGAHSYAASLQQLAELAAVVPLAAELAGRAKAAKELAAEQPCARVQKRASSGASVDSGLSAELQRLWTALGGYLQRIEAESRRRLCLDLAMAMAMAMKAA